jgi:hypothetical protein
MFQKRYFSERENEIHQGFTIGFRVLHNLFSESASSEKSVPIFFETWVIRNYFRLFLCQDAISIAKSGSEDRFSNAFLAKAFFDFLKADNSNILLVP